MFIEIKITTEEGLHSLEHLIRDIIMATIDDKVEAIGKDVKTILASLGTSSNAAILAAIAGVQATSNTILAQDMPTPPTAPVLTALSPTSGSVAGGETITATGTGFEGVTGVLVGTVAATNVVVASDTSLSYTSPAQGAGPEDVTIVGPGGTSAVVPAGVYTYS